MLEGIILGIIQGITEWLPVSSEGILVLVKSNFFGEGESLREMIGFAVFLHLGTFLAALLYFRRDVWMLLKGLVNYRSAEKIMWIYPRIHHFNLPLVSLNSLLCTFIQTKMQVLALPTGLY